MQRLWATLVLCLVTAFAAPGTPASAANDFTAVRTVNGAAITRYDVTQRRLFLEALGASGNLGDLALEQLTEDRVKTQAAKTLGIELPEGAVDGGLEEFATARGITADDVLRILDARKIDRQTIDDFIEAGIAWREVVGTRFRAQSLPTDAEIDAALRVQATQPQEILQLAEIALPFAERGEAETTAFAQQLYRDIARGSVNFTDAVRAYSRSASAEQDGRLDPMPATGLPATIRTQILLLKPGQTTTPIPISGGVAILQLVSTKTAPPEKIDPQDPAVRQAARERLFNQRITIFGQGYLQELIGDAFIVNR